MRILLLHLDGKLPNLALMRIAHHHRALGHEVTLRRAGNPTALQPRFDDRTPTGRPATRLEDSATAPRCRCFQVLEMILNSNLVSRVQHNHVISRS